MVWVWWWRVYESGVCLVSVDANGTVEMIEELGTTEELITTEELETATEVVGFTAGTEPRVYEFSLPLVEGEGTAVLTPVLAAGVVVGLTTGVLALVCLTTGTLSLV